MNCHQVKSLYESFPRSYSRCFSVIEEVCLGKQGAVAHSQFITNFSEQFEKDDQGMIDSLTCIIFISYDTANLTDDRELGNL